LQFSFKSCYDFLNSVVIFGPSFPTPSRICAETCAGCGVQLDVVFVLDLSGSVEEAYGLVLELARRTIGGLYVDRASGSRVAIITYSDQATVKFYLDEYSTTADVLNALVFRRAGKQCESVDGIKLTRTDTRRATGRAHILDDHRQYI